MTDTHEGDPPPRRERRSPDTPVTGFGKRADDATDARIVFLEKHILSFINAKFEKLTTDLAATFQIIINTSMGDLPKRVTNLEGRELRTVLVSVAASVLVVFVILVSMKMARWI